MSNQHLAELQNDLALSDASCCGARRRRWTLGVNDMPPAVLLAYVFIGWEESFPGTAIKALLMRELNLSLPTVTTYYAVTYMPWMWKPVYGWISDNFPIAGYHRTPYIAIAAAGNAASFVALAACAHSVLSVFVIATSQMICNAFLQLMVGSFLVDIARRDVKESATLQSLANAAKWVGTFTAQLCALIVYARGTESSHQGLLTTRQAIALTAVAPALLAVSVPWLGESAQVRSSRRILCCSKSNRQDRVQLSSESVRVGLVVALVQLNLVVIGCQSLMTRASWEAALVISAVVSFLMGCLGFAGLRYCAGSPNSASDAQLVQGESRLQRDFKWRWARIALFCFCANVIPGSGVSVDMLQLAVFRMESYQTLGLISSLTGLFTALAFGGGFRHWPIRTTIAASVLVAAVAGLAPLPFAFMAMDDAAPEQKGSLLSPLGALGISASIVTSISMVFTVLPIDTLVTSACSLEGSEKSSTALAVFLSCYSFGATIGGLVSAPLLAALGLDGKNWQSLPSWIIATACAKFLILLLLPILPPIDLDLHQSQPEQTGVQTAIRDEGNLQNAVCT